MMNNDYDRVQQSLNRIGERHFFDEKDSFINPYKNKNGAQSKCNHMWLNETDAIYCGPKGSRVCAICGKKF